MQLARAAMIWHSLITHGTSYTALERLGHKLCLPLLSWPLDLHICAVPAHRLNIVCRKPSSLRS
jgi:hypothetical protein